MTCLCPEGRCPVAAAGLGLPCPTLFHPRLAELFARDPATWGPRLVELAPRFAGWVPVHGTDDTPATARPARESAPPRAGPPLPSLATRAANFAAAVARHVAGGLPRADDATKAVRLAACHACDRLRRDGRCAECGCPVEVKAGWAGERCPLGKWEAVEPPRAEVGGCGCRK